MGPGTASTLLLLFAFSLTNGKFELVFTVPLQER